MSVKVKGASVRDFSFRAGRTLLMGVLNVTDDSFSDGGCFLDPHKAAEHAFKMTEAGADIIDIGGESSRPGAEPVSAEEELSRVIPVLRLIKRDMTVPVSIDTCKSVVAEAALEEGAVIVNDIAALRADEKMADIVASHGAHLVLMHMKGRPSDMQRGPVYEDLMGEICEYLSGAISIAEAAGVAPGKIAVDPGIGFGKTLEHNLLILKHLEKLKQLGKPIMVGTSRKSFLGAVTGRPVDERVMGTAASVTAAILKGASIVRVHDVALMKDVVMLSDAIMKVEG